MKKILFIMVATAIIFTGCKKNDDDVYEAKDAPPYAASKKVWKIESPDGQIKQIWSDHIQVPACLKKSFDGGTDDDPKADCRSDTYEETSIFYYSWQYVVQNRPSLLCPDPWRVPTKDDYIKLSIAMGGDERGVEFYSRSDANVFMKTCGFMFGGAVNGSGSPGSLAHDGYYWSSDVSLDRTSYCACIDDNTFDAQESEARYWGFSVRCIR
jgi:uncharacterized protein (TIGR02145 family)